MLLAISVTISALLFGDFLLACDLPAEVVASSALSVGIAPVELETEEPGTWSMAAIDFHTGEIGIVGASCTNNVQGIGEIIPGVGIVVVQGMSSDEARELGLKLLMDGKSPATIVEAMRAKRFEPENQQYAVVSVKADQAPATYTGKETDTWHGAVTGRGVSVQGNSLVSEAVVMNTFAVF